jgi:predicted nucleic acid-binding protein
MKVGLDTSVVLRLLLGQPADQAQRAVAFLETVAHRGDQPVVSDLVAAETYFALQHHYAVPKKDALAALRRMFADGEIESQGVVLEVLALEGLASAKPGFVDRLIQGAYISNGGSMATFEKASGKLDAVQIL